METSRILFPHAASILFPYSHNEKCEALSSNLGVQELAVYKKAERELQMYLIRHKMKE
jgi:hypothetical protein